MCAQTDPDNPDNSCTIGTGIIIIIIIIIIMFILSFVKV